MNAAEIVLQLSLEEKAALCSGADFWHIKGLMRFGIEPAMVTDGPHGLRKQAGSADHLGINQSVQATCFPTASATACSFDRNLMREMGAALSEECLQEDVAVLLGPGANIKRSPLCGRNFEYISEDPYITGELAAALIEGVQSNGVGVSMKHFAANNQEKARMTSNSVIDERALREIYLAGFETAVKKQQPWTLMCSYNKINDIYACENPTLLQDILRKEWGFTGIVMTDWGAMDERADAVAAGLDLEMPGPSPANDAKIVAAVQAGVLSEKVLDKAVVGIVELLLKAQGARRQGYTYSVQAHNALAQRIAVESAVLLKNEDGVLPISKTGNIAVLGAFAKSPRYQGSGSSRIHPAQTDCVLDALAQKGLQVKYAAGYTLTDDAPDDALLAQAAALAAQCDVALVFAGLPDVYESEGFDRTTLAMPESHNRLIEAACNANQNTIVVLQCGSPVQMPWLAAAKGVLLCYLGGQASGSACADLLLGDANPCGKLAETFPLCIEDTPACLHFAGGNRTEEYRESIFVGYRYYDTAKRPVLFPFGHGLSYTHFAYDDICVSADAFAPEKGGEISVEVTVSNRGACAGAEIVQLYVAKQTSAIYRAEKELKGFAKVFLQPGERKKVPFTLDARSFAYYNCKAKCWAVEGGEYALMAGGSSQKLPLCATLIVTGDGKESLLAAQRTQAPDYFDLPQTGTLSISEAAFTAVYGKPLPPKKRSEHEPFTLNSTIGEVCHLESGKQLLQMVQQGMAQMGGGDIQRMMEAMVMDMPLRALGMLGGGSMQAEQLEAMVAALNA